MAGRSPLPPRRVAATALGIVALGVAGASVAGCGGGGPTTTGYCRAVDERLAQLANPSIVTAEDVEAAIEHYRDVLAEAPAGIEPEWAQLVVSLETAATVDPGDQSSVQRVADTARASKRAATRVQQYTQSTCGLAIGDVPPVTNPVTATTVAGAPTTDAG